ncbi:MBL fold metallo-hydrolase [Bacteroidota bacterium]
MNFKIHRGTQEIGGSCVEIWTEKTRILVDFGMPLVEHDGSEFDPKKYAGLGTKELVSKNILPDVEGIYKDAAGLINGVLISHPHQDHYGFVSFLHDDLRYYLGEASYRIINTANLFVSKDPLFSNHVFIEREKPFVIGDLKITPYWMDHSAFDAYAFLIEGDEKSIFYSGDFRGHGRKTEAYQRFLRYAPKNVDYLLLEGTMIGRSISREKTEDELQTNFEVLFKQNKLNLVSVSGQNIDRLVSIYKACNAAGKTLVIDPYIANILKDAARFARIMHPSHSFSNIKVLFPWFLTGRMLDAKHEELIFPLTPFKIVREEINQDPGKYAVCIRPSLKFELEQMPNIGGGNHIYSQWEGYLKKDYTKKIVDYLANRGYAFHQIHTSGHADIPTLKEFVNAIQPKHIVPIHTFGGGEYGRIFDTPVKELKDGEDFQIN